MGIAICESYPLGELNRLLLIVEEKRNSNVPSWPSSIFFTRVCVLTLILRESLTIRAVQLYWHFSIWDFRSPWILTVRTTNKPSLDPTGSKSSGIELPARDNFVYS